MGCQGLLKYALFGGIFSALPFFFPYLFKGPVCNMQYVPAEPSSRGTDASGDFEGLEPRFYA